VRPNRIRQRWADGQPVVSGWLSIGSSYSAEAAGHSGFDCVTVDLQHGMYDFETAIAMMQALSSTPATPLVRVPSTDAALIMKLLDAGAYGVICPMVNTAEQAAEFVASTKYPPDGHRSFGPSRGLLYGGSDYFKHADDTIVRLAMIETVAGLENVEAICRVPGLDGVFIGPNDLGLTLGHGPAGDPVEPEVLAAVTKIRDTAIAGGKHAGIFCPSGKIAQSRIEDGFDFVVPNSDMNLFRQAIARELSELTLIER